MPGIDDRVLAALQGLGLPYEIIDIDPAFADTAAFCEKYDYPQEKSANTIIVASKKEPRKYCTCVILATSRLDVNHQVKRLLGVSKASFATSEQMAQLTGMLEGGVTPLALPPDLPIYVDTQVMRLDWIILGGGGRHLKIKISPQVFTKLGALVVEGLGKE